MSKQAELVLDPRAVTLEGVAAVERAARPAQQPLRATAINNTTGQQPGNPAEGEGVR